MDAAKSTNTIIAGLFLFLKASRVPKASRNQQKTNLKSMKTCIDNKVDVGMDVGRLLDRFLVDFGSKLEGKMEPSWH